MDFAFLSLTGLFIPFYLAYLVVRLQYFLYVYRVYTFLACLLTTCVRLWEED